MHAGDRHRRSVKPPFGSTRRHVCAMNEDRIWPTQFPRRSSSCLERAPTTHLRSTTISRGQFRAGLKTYLFNLAFYTQTASENFCWRVYWVTYLLYDDGYDHSRCHEIDPLFLSIASPQTDFSTSNSRVTHYRLAGNVRCATKSGRRPTRSRRRANRAGSGSAGTWVERPSSESWPATGARSRSTALRHHSLRNRPP